MPSILLLSPKYFRSFLMSESDFDEGSIISSLSSETVSLIDHPNSAMDCPRSPTDVPYSLSRSDSLLELDNSWHELDSVVPLLKLLPALEEVNGFYVSR